MDKRRPLQNKFSQPKSSTQNTTSEGQFNKKRIKTIVMENLDSMSNDHNEKNSIAERNSDILMVQKKQNFVGMPSML